MLGIAVRARAHSGQRRGQAQAQRHQGRSTLHTQSPLVKGQAVAPGRQGAHGSGGKRSGLGVGAWSERSRAHFRQIPAPSVRSGLRASLPLP